MAPSTRSTASSAPAARRPVSCCPASPFPLTRCSTRLTARRPPESSRAMTVPDLNLEDRGSLARYLVHTGRLAVAEDLAAFTVLPGGVSSRTVRVGLRSGTAWVLKQALPKLRVAVDWFSDPARIHREALGLRRLAGLAPPGTVPVLVFEDAEQHV